MMKYFVNCKTLDELKKQYRRLAMKYHPDCGGDTATMQQINAEHDALFEVLKKQHNASADEYHQTTETAEEFRTVIDFLMTLDGVVAELCGSWIWCSGDTKPHKEALKGAGFHWSQNKKQWYWHHEEPGRKWRRGNTSMADIRRKYGSQVFNGSREETGFEKIGAAC